MSDLTFPLYVQIEPTNYCNFTCPKCPTRAMQYSKGLMEENIFVSAINQITGHKTLVKLFFLGEPFLHPDIDVMIVYAHAKGVPTCVVTNGSLITERQIELLLKNVYSFSISIDGTDSESYMKIRRGGNYAQLRRTIQKICDTNKDHAMSFTLTTILPDTGYNAYLAKFVEEWKDFDVKITALQLQHHEKSWAAPKRDYVCPDGLQGLVIRWDGKITYCCGDVNTETVLGTLPKDSLADIWNGDMLRRIHDDINQQKYDRWSCRKCNVYYRTFPKSLLLTQSIYDKLAKGMQDALIVNKA